MSPGLAHAQQVMEHMNKEHHENAENEKHDEKHDGKYVEKHDEKRDKDHDRGRRPNFNNDEHRPTMPPPNFNEDHNND